jgi:hypothetical protein
MEPDMSLPCSWEPVNILCSQADKFILLHKKTSVNNYLISLSIL